MATKPTMLGNFEELVLLAILKLGPEAYGVPIRHALSEALNKQVSVGALYTTLERLADKGYITSKKGEATEERGNRAKHYYQVEGTGLAALKETEAAREKVKSLDLVGGVA